MFIAGCRALPTNGNAEKNCLDDLDKADSLVLSYNQSVQKLSDRETINRLAAIYTSAKWETYWHTLPGGLGDRSIDIYLRETKLRHMSYTGVLWENRDYSANRTSAEDRLWIESLFDAVPNR